MKIERATALAGPYTLITTTAANATTYNSTGLTAGTAYFYRVSATNAIGDSATITATATTQGTAPTIPSTPTQLTATAVSTSQINLAWTDNSTNETGFKIERAPALTGPYTLVTTTAANATTSSSTGLTISTPYFYRVSATNALGDSATITANATTLAADPATNDSSSSDSKSCGIGSGLSAIGGLILLGLAGLMGLWSRRRS